MARRPKENYRAYVNSLRSQKILLNISNFCQNNSSCLVGPVSCLIMMIIIMLLTLSVEKYTYGTSIDKLLVRKWNIV